MRSTILCAASVLLLLCMAPLGHADSFKYELNLKYDPTPPVISATPLLTATFEDVDKGVVRLTMQANGLDEHVYIDSWFFNTKSAKVIQPEFLTNESSGPEGDVSGIVSNADGAAKFQLKFDFSPDTENSDLFDAKDTVVYLLSGGGLTASFFDTKNDDGNGKFYSAALLRKAEVNSYIGATLSIAPVPEPATMLLFGMGLSGFGLWVRRRSAH